MRGVILSSGRHPQQKPSDRYDLDSAEVHWDGFIGPPGNDDLAGTVFGQQAKSNSILVWEPNQIRWDESLAIRLRCKLVTLVRCLEIGGESCFLGGNLRCDSTSYVKSLFSMCYWMVLGWRPGCGRELLAQLER